ncbi:MAG: U32 family peptidase [Deltaproteobacteria bacterium]|nr:MAG: U32 family peptidase [Deltaproteobacteria bacterium]
MTQRIVELLAPAGNLEKLKVTVSYGCDAVYLGGEKFGLRSAADNFINSELAEGVKFAHDRSVKVYVVLNSFLYDRDLKELPEFLIFLEKVRVDAVIISDLGVLKTVKELTNIPIHLSTQASCLNVEAGKLWKKMGVKRLILGREVSIAEASKIKKATGLEIELFIHGSLCMAYSGNCVISNYTMGRDSNRGGCAHNCRFEYSLDFKDKKENSFFMSSKDLMGIAQVPEFFSHGIDSVKVEGRMKTHLYVGTITKAYKRAISHYEKNASLSPAMIAELEGELRKVSHRDYTEGNLTKRADEYSIFDKREHLDVDYMFVGQVVETKMGEHILMEVRNPFFQNDQLELLPFSEKEKTFKAFPLENILGEVVEKAHPGMLVKLPYVEGVENLNLIRGRSL